MSKQRQTFTMLDPLPTLAVDNTPQRLSTVDRWVRSVSIEAPSSNKGDMYISDSEAKATTLNRHTLVKGAVWFASGDKYGNLDVQINLKDIWFNGAKAADILVVSYFPIDVEIC